MTPVQVLEQAAADGVRLTISPPDSVTAAGRLEAVQRWAPVLRQHKSELIRQARLDRLQPNFQLVVTAFNCSGAEITEAWALALSDLDAAEASFTASAALIRAGWKPLSEPASGFRARLQEAL